MSLISAMYRKLDQKAGGWLPGGQSPSDVKKQSQPKQVKQEKPIDPLAAAMLKKKPASTPQPASVKAANEVNNSKQRLKAAGVKPDAQVHEPSLLSKTLDILDRPRNAVAGEITAFVKGEGLKGATKRSSKAFQGKEKYSGQDLLKTVENSNIPIVKDYARLANKTKYGKFVGGLALDIGLDPTTFVGVGKTVVEKGTDKIAKSIVSEVEKETGKKIAISSATKLAENAKKGNIPTGKMGAAINRAMGADASVKEVKNGLGKMSAMERRVKAKNEAAGLKTEAEDLLSQAKDMAVQGKDLSRQAKDEIRLRKQAAKDAAKAQKQSIVDVAKQDLNAAKSVQGEAQGVLKTVADRGQTAGKIAGAESKRDAMIQMRLEKRAAREAEKLAQKAAKAKESIKAIDPMEAAKKAKETTENSLDAVDISENAYDTFTAPDPIQAVKNAINTGQNMREKFFSDTARHYDREVPALKKSLDSAAANVSGKVDALEAARKAKIAAGEIEPPTDMLTQAGKLSDDARVLKEQAFAKQEAAKQTVKDAKAIPAAETTSKVVQTFGKPTSEEERTFLKFAGQNLVDVTPLKNKLGSTIDMVPGMTRLKDALGRVFVFNYTPTGLEGLERSAVVAAKELIVKGWREAPYQAEKALQSTLKELSDISPDVAKRIPSIIEKTGSAANSIEKQAADAVAQIFADDVKKFEQAKIPLNVLDNYIPHLYTDSPTTVKRILSNWRGRVQKVEGSKPFFTAGRTIPTIEQAKELGLHPVEDARILAGVHRALTEQAVTLQRMGQDILQMPDVVSKAHRYSLVDGKEVSWVKLGDNAPPSLQQKFVHPEVARTLEALWPMLTNSDEGLNILQKTFSTFTNGWKALVLATPQFHLTNFLGNVWLNAADGMLNPNRYTQATALLTGAVKDVEVAGQRMTREQVLDAFSRMGLSGQGMFNDIVRPKQLTQEAIEALNKLDGAGYKNVAYLAKHPFEASRRMGEWTDTMGRMASFIHHLDLGESVEQAAKSVRNALFDYSELTPAEQAVRKYLMPFYTWKRKAIPKIFEKVIGAPGMFTSIAHIRDNAMQANEIDTQHLPDYLRDNMSVPLYVDEKGMVYFLKTNLPLTELANIHDPLNIREWNKEFISMLNPYLSTPFQMGMNQVAFTGQPITDTPDLQDEALKDYGMFLISTFGGLPGRDLVNAQVDTRQQMMDTMKGTVKAEKPTKTLIEQMGFPMSTQNPAKWAESDTYRERDLLRQQIKSAQSEGVQVPTSNELKKAATSADPLEAAMQARYGKQSLKSVPVVSGGLDASDPLTAARMAAAPRLNVGSAPSFVVDAVSAAGVGQDWIPYMTYLLQRENPSMNPAARNPQPVWYSKRDGYQHATGMYQTMPPTFNKYALPGHGDIYSPLDNTIAAIRYIQSRYGHPSNIKGLFNARYPGY